MRCVIERVETERESERERVSDRARARDTERQRTDLVLNASDEHSGGVLM